MVAGRRRRCALPECTQYGRLAELAEKKARARITTYLTHMISHTRHEAREVRTPVEDRARERVRPAPGRVLSSRPFVWSVCDGFFM